jgi:hypothetical protein
MATATQKQPVARQVGRETVSEPGPGAISFVVFEDNGGDYRWTMVDGDGMHLARSRAFATYDAADTSAGAVRDTAGAGRVEPRPAGT